MQKLYCYVDESGQNPKSEVFIVVAVVSAKGQDKLRRQLEEIEHTTGTGRKKWHKLRPSSRIQYLVAVLKQKIASKDVYIARYKKPIPYFFPLIDILERSLKKVARGRYQARIYVDGIDKQKSKALTNALRAGGISLRMVKSRRDESEPLIRLADMWAGCIRSAFCIIQTRNSFSNKLKEKAICVIYRHHKTPAKQGFYGAPWLAPTQGRNQSLPRRAGLHQDLYCKCSKSTDTVKRFVHSVV